MQIGDPNLSLLYYSGLVPVNGQSFTPVEASLVFEGQTVGSFVSQWGAKVALDDIRQVVLAAREGTGRRPVIVVSHDGFNEAPRWRSVLVVPVSTSEAQAARGPTVVPLVEGAGGLRQSGVALCHQVATLDRAKLTERLGALPGAALAQVEDGLKIALGME